MVTPPNTRGSSAGELWRIGLSVTHTRYCPEKHILGQQPNTLLMLSYKEF